MQKTGDFHCHAHAFRVRYIEISRVSLSVNLSGQILAFVSQGLLSIAAHGMSLQGLHIDRNSKAFPKTKSRGQNTGAVQGPREALTLDGVSATLSEVYCPLTHHLKT
jgi:hypothetical protein